MVQTHSTMRPSEYFVPLPMPPLLYYITDRSQFAGDEPAQRLALLRKIREAAEAGVDFIQLREKDLSGRELENLARAAALLVHQAREAGSITRLLINGRLDITIAVNADGIHLPSRGMSVAETNQILGVAHIATSGAKGERALIGISCHSATEVAEATRAGVSLIAFGPVFEKRDSPEAQPAGLEALRSAVAAAANISVFALGGVNLENARSCLDVGAAGIAGIRLFQEHDIASVGCALRDV